MNILRPRFTVLALLILFSSCSQQSNSINIQEDWQLIAESVNIKRDHYGVPHIYGPTDAHVIFGLAYARAEDHFNLIEEQVIRAIGRQAEVQGVSGIHNDYVTRAFDFEGLSKKEYRDLSPENKAALDAYASGLNFYLSQNPEEVPLLIERFEGWHFLALYRRSWTSAGFSQIGVFDDEVNRFLNEAAVEPRKGSNMWAISPSKSGNQKTYLVLNPHIPMDQPYEVHLKSKEGLNFYGELAYGENIFPVLGHNQNLGWSLTTNYPDIADRFAVQFEDSTRLNRYYLDGQLREAKKWKDTIWVKEGTKTTPKLYSFTQTVHGPVLRFEGSKGISYRIAGIEEGGMMQQFYQMSKASNLNEFKSAISSLSIPYHNFLYADKDGNIYFVYNSKTPKRSEGIDWTKTVDGGSSANLWKGYHTLDELPSLENPEVGYIQNCNTSPYFLTSSENPKEEDFPSYMAIYEVENERGKRSKTILDTLQNISLNRLEKAIMDTYVPRSEVLLPQLFQEFEKLSQAFPSRAKALEEPIAELRAWDGYADSQSVATSLYFIFDEHVHHEMLGKIFPIQHPKTSAEWPLTTFLKQTVDLMVADQGSWNIPWGEINRHQRTVDNDDFKVDETLPSVALKGGSSITGIMFCAYRLPVLIDNTVKRRSDAGHSYVSIVEFGEETKARSIIPYGISRDPASSHYFDQADLFAQGFFKSLLFSDEEVNQYLEEEYRPGEKR